MEIGKKIVAGIRNRWLLLWACEVFLYALGPAIFLALIGMARWAVIICFFVLWTVLMLFKKPWRLTLAQLCATMDKGWDSLEYSTGLLLIPGKELSNLALLQKYRITAYLKEGKKEILPRTYFKRGAIISLIGVGLGLLLSSLNGRDRSTLPEQLSREHIFFTPKDSSASLSTVPSLEEQTLTIHYPAYTKLPPLTTSKMDIRALEGSKVSWALEFDMKVDSVLMESMGTSFPMEFRKGTYQKSINLGSSGFYNFRFVSFGGVSYFSELFPLEVIKDKSPVIEIQDIDQFTSFEMDAPKQLKFNVRLRDDYGIDAAYIIATVSKGTGESVKFREIQMKFDDSLTVGNRDMRLSKELDLDLLEMEAGDELYFYVEAKDQKTPNSNISRSETYFAVIRDTVSNTFAVEGSLGVELMPDYFRSQRQLIIDTEKLIQDRSSLSKPNFDSASNELGFDQKALRIKYGEFMGDETETGSHEGEETLNHSEHNGDNPLEGYTHDHDGDNSHNLVEDPHLGEHTETDGQDPLESYLHNHDDPEESTLFTQALKSKLRQAIDQMWDAELHLRMFSPEKSLPYQYRALKLIQEIKNSARIYVHRIGFDPPPIKEEVRLSGTIEEVDHYEKTDRIAVPEKYPAMRRAIVKLEQIKISGGMISGKDRDVLKEAGIELASKAVVEPGKYLYTLQLLKRLEEEKEHTLQMLMDVQRGLLFALPEPQPDPQKQDGFYGELEELLLQELQSHD